MSGIPNTVKYIFSKALKPPLYKLYITHSMYHKICLAVSFQCLNVIVQKHKITKLTVLFSMATGFLCALISLNSEHIAVANRTYSHGCFMLTFIPFIRSKDQPHGSNIPPKKAQWVTTGPWNSCSKCCCTQEIVSRINYYAHFMWDQRCFLANGWEVALRAEAFHNSKSHE